MPDHARRLNEQGMDAFQRHIQELADGTKLDTPAHLLTDPRYSEEIDTDVEVDPREFQTRFELGIYLTDILKETPIQALMGDTGFWSWLALYWFDQLCPQQANGTRKPSKPYNYILSPNYNHRPRHALFTTWMLVNRYGDTALFLLSKGPHERGELIEQLAARQYLISCQGVIETAKELYYDPERKTFKRGATSQKRQGNIRRFISYLQQLDLTYDLGTLASDALLEMLPDEYSAFRSITVS
ncbi:MAG: hypothetical protein JAY90_18300 [Candidatus Thiodiazotropha lotti]|nr:hypothetical protein [Candidatus Thiodiazotropha lotti]